MSARPSLPQRLTPPVSAPETRALAPVYMGLAFIHYALAGSAAWREGLAR